MKVKPHDSLAPVKSSFSLIFCEVKFFYFSQQLVFTEKYKLNIICKVQLTPSPILP